MQKIIQSVCIIGVFLLMMTSCMTQTMVKDNPEQASILQHIMKPRAA